jgi:branched-chain amino acid transport system permease protein
MLSGKSQLIPPAAGVVALVAWPYVFSSPFDIRMFTLAGVYALMAIGYQFVFGYAGALALSQATFFGLGAYATALLATKFGAGFAITFPASIGIAVLLASAIALPLLRLSSHYFALATLGVAQVVALLATEWVSLTGGANGLPGVPVPVIFGLGVPRGWPLMLLTWSIAAFGAVLAWHLTRGLYGTVLHVLREDELTERSLGIDTDALAERGLWGRGGRVVRPHHPHSLT